MDDGHSSCHDFAVGFRLLAIGLIAGLLAACTSSHADPKPSATPTGPTHSKSSTAASASPSRTGPLTTGPNVRPGEKPPVYPALAKQHTANGALAFAIYFLKVFDWGYATNDASALNGLVLPDCSGCGQYKMTLAAVHARAQTLIGGRLTQRSATFDHARFHFDADFVIDIAVDEQAIVLRGPGVAPKTVAAALRSHHTLVFLRWKPVGWQVADVTAK